MSKKMITINNDNAMGIINEILDMCYDMYKHIPRYSFPRKDVIMYGDIRLKLFTVSRLSRAISFEMLKSSKKDIYIEIECKPETGYIYIEMEDRTKDLYITILHFNDEGLKYDSRYEPDYCINLLSEFKQVIYQHYNLIMNDDSVEKKVRDENKIYILDRLEVCEKYKQLSLHDYIKEKNRKFDIDGIKVKTIASQSDLDYVVYDDLYMTMIIDDIEFRFDYDDYYVIVEAYIKIDGKTLFTMKEGDDYEVIESYNNKVLENSNYTSLEEVMDKIVKVLNGLYDKFVSIYNNFYGDED